MQKTFYFTNACAVTFAPLILHSEHKNVRLVSIFVSSSREPEVEIMEYDGRLSQDDLAKLAANSERIEVSIVDKHLQFLALYKMFV